MNLDFLPTGSNLLFQVVAMCLTALILPKVTISSLLGPVSAVCALAFINASYWESSLFYTIPEAFNSRVFALVLANGVLFWVVVKVVPGIDIEGFWPAILAPIIFTICTILLKNFAPEVSIMDMLLTALRLLGQVRDYFMATQTETVALLHL